MEASYLETLASGSLLTCLPPGIHHPPCKSFLTHRAIHLSNLSLESVTHETLELWYAVTQFLIYVWWPARAATTFCMGLNQIRLRVRFYVALHLKTKYGSASPQLLLGCVLTTFMSTWHSYSHLRIRTSIEKMPPWDWARAKPGAFSLWLMGEGSACGGWCHACVGGPESNKKAGWASPEQQASKQCPSMTTASSPASRILPCFSSCPICFWWWTVSKVCPWLCCITTARITWRQTVCVHGHTHARM